MSNQAKFDEASASVLPGKEGVRHDGALYKEAKWANKNSADAKKGVDVLMDRFAAGKAGVRFDGDLYGMLRRIDGNTVVITQLVSALRAVAGGESFDQEKLLAAIEKLLAEAVVKVEVSVEGGK